MSNPEKISDMICEIYEYFLSSELFIDIRHNFSSSKIYVSIYNPKKYGYTPVIEAENSIEKDKIISMIRTEMDKILLENL